jgi:hypothetical protein
VEPNNPVALAQALASVLGNVEVRGPLVTNGYESAQNFSMARLAREYESMYRTLLEAEARREIDVPPSRLLKSFNERLLRRSRFRGE